MSTLKFKTFLSYHWYVFISIFLVVSILYYYIFAAINTPSFAESVQVFIAARYVDKEGLEKKLFNGFDDSSIKQVNVDYSDQDSNNFNSVFQTRGLVNTDILILPTDIISAGNYYRYFAPLEDTVLAPYLVDIETSYYVDESVNYGLQLQGRALDFIEGNADDEYYIFFNKNSIKTAGLNVESTNDAALVTLVNLWREINI